MSTNKGQHMENRQEFFGNGDSEMISVIDAGRQLERRKTTIFKVMKRLGIHAQKRRDTNSGNQFVSYLTRAEYVRVREALSDVDAGIGNEGPCDVDDSFVSSEIGVFYLIQLEPEFDPLRFKVGFAANIGDRLRVLRCSAPFSAVVKSWPCRRLWEKTVIDCASFGCDRLHTEVFRCSSLEEIVVKCDQFFEMMPPILPSSTPPHRNQDCATRTACK